MRAKVKMSEFFLELFSEEIPAKLQVNARVNIYSNFKKFFEENDVDIKGQIKVFSTPNRLIVYIDKIPKNIILLIGHTYGAQAVNSLLFVSKV